MSPCPFPTTITITPRAPPQYTTGTFTSLFMIVLFSNVFWLGLVWFYGISTIVGYLMPNLFLFIRHINHHTMGITPIDWTIIVTTIRGPGSNVCERVLCTTQSSRTWALPQDKVSGDKTQSIEHILFCVIKLWEIFHTWNLSVSVEQFGYL